MSQAERTLGRIALCLTLATVALYPAFATATEWSPRGEARGRLQRRGLPPLTPAPRDALTRALEVGVLDPAEYALERARSIFQPHLVRRRFGSVIPPATHDASLIMRDLFARRGELSQRHARLAERVLARPTEGATDPAGNGYTTDEQLSACSAHMCFHWVSDTEDAPPPADATGDGIPDWVETTMGVFESVWATEIEMLGYRQPKSDADSFQNGGDGRLDVYLTDLGDERIYGYCTSDDPDQPEVNYAFYDVSAYCVVDNDYLDSVFATSEPLAILQVTAAHEFFHAVQYAYDAYEDLWLMEGTAVWMEDEVFDAVNDNYQYLGASPLRAPHVPIDLADGPTPYGSWLFWRYLSESLGPAGEPDPTIVKEVWEHADGSPLQTSDNDYSVSAVKDALAARGRVFETVWASFGVANFAPAIFYEEGPGYLNETGPTQVTKRYTLSSARSKTLTRSVRVKHLATRFVVFTRGGGLGRSAKLEVSVNLPQRSSGARASVVVVEADGALGVIRRIGLSDLGKGSLRVGFGSQKVRSVVLVLSNASTRFACSVGAPYSCSGRPLDDRGFYFFGAKVLR